jgi:PTS system mannose-specific IID component
VVKLTLARVFLRSFLIQGCWNYEGMQNVGFAFGMSPVIKEVASKRADRASILNDHLGYFNSHPYFSSAILGAAASAQMRDGTAAAREIREIKDTLSNPFAALGDTLFWSTLKPLFSIVATATAFFGSLWSPVIFLVLYNTFHLWIRSGGFISGVREKMGVMRYVKRLDIPRVSVRMKAVTLALLSILTAGAAFFLPSLSGTGGPGELRALVIVGVLLVAFLTRKGIGVLTQVYIFSIILLVIFSLVG